MPPTVKPIRAAARALASTLALSGLLAACGHPAEARVGPSPYYELLVRANDGPVRPAWGSGHLFHRPGGQHGYVYSEEQGLSVTLCLGCVLYDEAQLVVQAEGASPICIPVPEEGTDVIVLPRERMQARILEGPLASALIGADYVMRSKDRIGPCAQRTSLSTYQWLHYGLGRVDREGAVVLRGAEEHLEAVVFTSDDFFGGVVVPVPEGWLSEDANGSALFVPEDALRRIEFEDTRLTGTESIDVKISYWCKRKAYSTETVRVDIEGGRLRFDVGTDGLKDVVAVLDGADVVLHVEPD